MAFDNKSRSLLLLNPQELFENRGVILFSERRTAPEDLVVVGVNYLNYCYNGLITGELEYRNSDGTEPLGSVDW